MDNSPFTLLLQLFVSVGYQEPVLTERYQQFLLIIENKALNEVSKLLSKDSQDLIENTLEKGKDEKDIQKVIETLDAVKNEIVKNVSPTDFRSIYKNAFMTTLNDYYSSIKDSLSIDQNSEIVRLIDEISKEL